MGNAHLVHPILEIREKVKIVRQMYVHQKGIKLKKMEHVKNVQITKVLLMTVKSIVRIANVQLQSVWDFVLAYLKMENVKSALSIQSQTQKITTNVKLLKIAT